MDSVSNLSAQITGDNDRPVACGHFCFQPDAHGGHDDDPELSRGAWAVAGSQWHEAGFGRTTATATQGLRLPGESGFGPTHARDVSSFLFPILRCVQAALKRTITTNITVLNIPR